MVQELGLRFTLRRIAEGSTNPGGGVAEESIWFCYMVRCRDGAFYIGIATDIEERVKRQNWGVGPEFTARSRPVELVWSECCGSCEAARKREKEIKTLRPLRGLRVKGSRPTARTPVSKTGYGGSNPSSPARVAAFAGRAQEKRKRTGRNACPTGLNEGSWPRRRLK